MTTEQALIGKIGIDIAIRQVRIGPHDINYAVAGSGQALLLIHGSNFGWGMWYANIAAFAKHFTVYALDLPGAGRSSVLDYRRFDPRRDFADVTLQFAKALGLKHISIVAHSAGGWIAVKMALAEPDLVRRMVLADPVGFSRSANLPERIIALYPVARAVAATLLAPRRDNPRLEAFIRQGFARNDLPIPEEFLDYFYETMKRSHGLLLVSRIIRMRDAFFLPEGLGMLRDRTLVIWGAKDPILPFRRSAVAAEVLEGVGHVPPIESPDVFNDVTLRFLS